MDLSLAACPMYAHIYLECLGRQVDRQAESPLSLKRCWQQTRHGHTFIRTTGEG